MPSSGYHILGASASRAEDTTSGKRAPTLVSVPNEAEARKTAVAYLESLVGTPYVWGGKDPAVGLDCSGAVTVAYEKARLALPGARYRYGSADLHKTLEGTTDPQPGDLAFYGKGRVSHVMMVVDEKNVVGATGGGPKTKTREDAEKIGAYVRKRPTDYRKDLVSYGRAPRVPLGGQAGTRLQTAEARGERAAIVGKGLLVLVFGGLAAWGASWWWRNR